MRLSTAAVLGDALALLRRDHALLLAIAGPFWFLPVLALRLLVPPAPPLPIGLAGPAEEAAALVLSQWLTSYGGWVVLAAAVGALGTVTTFVLYLDAERPDVGTALARGLRLAPRYILLNLLTALPSGAGLLLYALPGIFILARVMAAGPALVAEAPLGAWAALWRGVGLSRGATWPLMALVALTLLIGLLAPQPLVALDDWLRDRAGGPNPVALAMVDALAAAAAAASLLASALIAVAAYRRLAR